jgi:tRNA A37 N6-isopentenylltransferase MiaA
MHGIRHEMLDLVEPVRKFELEDYTRLARRHISDAFAANVVPLIVGGTGIYVTALLGDWETERVAAARRSLRRDFPRSMTDDACAMLRRLNRCKADQVHRNNYEAIINALAIIVSQGDSGSSDHLDLTTAIFGLDPGPQALDQRVAQTYDRQVQSGLFEEIKSLNARYDLDREIRLRGRDSQNQVLHTHGYREYFDVALATGKPVSGLTGSELAEVRARVVERIRRHTRRQRTWLSKLPGTRVVTSADQAFARVSRLLDTGR